MSISVSDTLAEKAWDPGMGDDPHDLFMLHLCDIYWNVLRIYLGFYGDWLGFNVMFLEFIRSCSSRIVCDFSWDLRRFSGNMMGQWSECLNGCSGNMMGIMYCHNFHTVSWAMVVSTGGQRAPKTIKSQICLLLPTGNQTQLAGKSPN